MTEIVAYEILERRPFGAPGEKRLFAILRDTYRMPDGSISGDWDWLVEQFQNAPTTISMKPLILADKQPLTDEQIAEVWNKTRPPHGTSMPFAFARAIERSHGIGGEV